ncbi:cyclin G [Lucilia sericata]|uniref:cyclin G n=1 Tax=Lucilia sericata TaxID=13632 RepID=UPI0018A84265|nr:cyclin G [Lucilia sericata]XP_037828420.1 cyclin G [Lucilia sericata]XP_037828421.1 cyclin G [Lucilia sericata]XP_037828422.1 cyclin G [Lucilia sericata]
MSVPVRYSAAANYAVADSGLTNTLNNNEHEQYQHYASEELYSSHLYNHHQQQQLNNSIYGFNSILEEQQQLMQQSTSMSVSAKPQEDLVGAGNSAAGAYHHHQMNHQEQATTSAKAREMMAAQLNEMPTTSAMAAAAAESANTAAINGSSHTAEMRTEWMRMSDEGRYGTPGAAGLDYQKFELEQQHQTTPNLMDQTMEPSFTDNEKNNSSSSNNNLEDELTSMSSEELYNTLKEYDALQDKYHTVLLLPKESRREVTAGGRDGSAYVLRCLKIWYELPSDVLFSAMSLVDRFLDRMAVKPKHMACMSVASFHLAIKQLNLKPIPAEDLVTISQCGCTAGDLERMAGVIANKLGVQMGHAPITSVSYLRIYFALFRNLAKEIGGQFFEFYKQLIKLEELENRLEILLCDVKTTVITPSTLALVLICLHLDFHIKESYTRGSPELKHVFEYILFLQQYMRIPDRVFTCGFSIVSGILSHYNGQNKQPYKQRLVWKLSSRTLRVLRPTNRFSTDLPTIDEGITNAMDDGLRSRTESISSEEEEDWPTSPIIPIFEQC